MSLTKSNFSVDARQGYLGAVGKFVTGTLTGPTSYAGSGEVLSNALALAVFGGRELLFLQFTPMFASGATTTSTMLQAAWEQTFKTPGADQGKIHFFNTGTSPHTHNLLVSGGVTLAGNDHLGSQGGRLCQPGTGTTIISDVNQAVVNATGVAGSTEVAGATNLSTYVARFFALVR